MCCRFLAMPTATMWLDQRWYMIEQVVFETQISEINKSLECPNSQRSQWVSVSLRIFLLLTLWLLWKEPDEFTEVIQHILQHSSLQGELCAALEEPCQKRIIWGSEWWTMVESISSTSCALTAFSCHLSHPILGQVSI